MTSPRVALIYDDTARPETTGGYCLRALKTLAVVEHFRPAELERVARTGYDLYLNVDDGLRYQMPVDLHPSAFWAIDTHMDFDWCLKKAHDFDLVFAAQLDGKIRLCDEGISATWLPLACDPEIHRKHDVPRTYDVCFVGNVFPGERANLLRSLTQHFRNSFVGRCYFEEMARTYSASRIVFNRGVRNDVNMRVFEAVACGSLLVTNDLPDNGQDELLRDGLHLATYRDGEELIDKVRFYLAREEVRERIAAAGRAEALARHTYRHRMEVILAEAARKTLRRVAVTEVIGGPGDSPFQGVEESAPPTQHMSCDRGYFEFPRPELLALIPETARRVLDVGCGAGRLGEALKARQSAEVVGIEYNAAAAESARTRLDRVLAGDVEKMHLPFAAGSFDTIVCGDVLEHLHFPEHFLRQACGWLIPGGRLIASIPNVRHHTVVRSLLEGNWTYEPAGLLDRTHLRFFTRRDIEELLRNAGFTISLWRATPGPGDEEWWTNGSREQVTAGRLHVGGLSPGEAEEFYVYQYLIVAQPGDYGSLPRPAVPAIAVQIENDTPAYAAEADRALPVVAVSTLEPEPGDSTPTEVSLTQPLPHDPAPEEPLQLRPTRGRSRHTRKLRIMLLGDFGSSWRHEAMTANALLLQGHRVSRFHEYLMPSVDHVLSELNSGRYDCLLFYKGRITARTVDEIFCNAGEAIAQVIERTRVPCFTWYVDRALQFDLQPSREAWMRRVAPLCRVAFVADGALARTPWANWHILREPIDHRSVQRLHVPDSQRKPLAFIGQLYGSREEEVAPLAAEFPIEFITGTYGSALSPAVKGYKIILGPRYPTVPGFWGNRVYVVLGHGGFFLAPEVQGMREEGILPGVHYAVLGDDPRADIRRWLACPEERDRIASAGQQLVLERFTYRHAVRELCRVIEETL